MSLPTGTRLGAYEIVSLLGSGGMGEVYRARDGKLNRDVALKILPEAFATDPDRLARFRREAQVLAALNHPNIGHIYGFEDSGALHALVLELVEGPTLADRIKPGPMALTDALAIAKQMAEALEAAHELGIVHRDLKPANVKVRADGAVKVLDFGLAKALGTEPVSAAADTMNSPTVTNQATSKGVILGTTAYMAPEQARGHQVDRRGDVWAFGVVLYEMLTGTWLFARDDNSDTLAAVLTHEPNWHALPAEMPPAIRRLLARCLAKDRRARLDSMAVARLEIEEALAAPTGTADAQLSRRVGVPVAFVLAGVGAAVASGWFLARTFTPASPAVADTPVISSVVAPPEAATAFSHGFALSLDGRVLVVSARSPDGTTRLWKRRLDDPRFEAIPETEGGTYPFWSPDGRDVGFFAQDAMKRVPIAGGPAQRICDATGPYPSASWGETGDILFSEATRPPSAGIFRVAAGGGPVSRVTAADDGYARHPQWLPGDRMFLYDGGPSSAPKLFAASIDGSRTPVRVLDLDPKYPGARFSSMGFLLFNRSEVLEAQRFDLASLAVTGTAVAIASKAGTPLNWLTVAVAGDTAVALDPPVPVGVNPGNPVARLRWVDRIGRTLSDLGQPARYWTLRLSPDGRRAAFTPDTNIWTIDVTTNLVTRVASSPVVTSSSVWSPDGRRIVFWRASSTWMKSADGEGPDVELFKDTDRSYVTTDWSADGRRLLLMSRPSPDRKTTSLWLYDFERKALRSYLSTDFDEREPRFSPDGRWVAYAANPSGRFEVYLRPLDGERTAVRISAGGGEHPIWRRDGQELFYLTPNDEVMAVNVSNIEGTFAPGDSHRLFQMVMNDITRDYLAPFDVAPNGQRFLVNVPEPPLPLTLIEHVSAFLKGAR
jgi:Tol biopolymer transport system component